MVPIEVVREMYEAVNARDVQALRAAARKSPAVLHAGWRAGNGPTFLHLTASKGLTELCEALVELGAPTDVLDPDDHSTPLMSAAAGGHVDTVKWLLDHKASADGWPTSIATPLMAAAAEGHVDVVRLLLDAGADVNREHLRLPQTALDFAELYKMKKSGQELVAALLRDRGAIRPYVDQHDWTNVPGEEHLRYIERAIGRVNPVSIPAEAGKGRRITLRKAVIAPKAEFKLLFTTGVVRFAGVEFALALPWRWPFNRDSLKISRFSWPIALLGRFARAAVDGEPFEHGKLVAAHHPAVKDAGVPPQILQWLAVNHESTDVDRGDEPATRLLTPIIAKKAIASGAATALADKKASAKWKVLAVPIEAAAEDHTEKTR